MVAGYDVYFQQLTEPASVLVSALLDGLRQREHNAPAACSWRALRTDRGIRLTRRVGKTGFRSLRRYMDPKRPVAACVIGMTVLFAAVSVGAQDDVRQDTPVSETSGILPKAETASTTLPDNEVELRAELSEIDSKVAELEAQAKIWKQLRTSLADYRESAQDATVPDLDRIIDEIRKANSGGKTADVQSAIRRLLRNFDVPSDLSGFFMISTRQQDPEVTSNIRKWSRKLQALFQPYKDSPLWKRKGDDFEFLTDTAAASTTTSAPPPALSAEELAELQRLNTASYKALRSQMGSLFDQWFADVNRILTEADRTIHDLRQRHIAVAKKLQVPRIEINELAIKLGLPLFCATVCLLFCIPIVARRLNRDDSADSLFSSGILVEINTVLLLTMTILILGLAGKIQGEVLGTLLGGISGYVLNRMRQRSIEEGEVPVVQHPASPHPPPSTSPVPPSTAPIVPPPPLAPSPALPVSAKSTASAVDSSKLA